MHPRRGSKPFCSPKLPTRHPAHAYAYDDEDRDDNNKEDDDDEHEDKGYDSYDYVLHIAWLSSPMRTHK